MEPFHVSRLPSILSLMLQTVERPDTNDKATQDVAFDYAIGKELEAKGKSLKDNAAKSLKKMYASKVENPNDEPETIIDLPDVTLLVKVDKPRETFDKDAFIQYIAQEYEIPLAKLYATANGTVRKTAPIVKFSHKLHAKV